MLLHEKKIIYFSSAFAIILVLVIVLVTRPNVKQILKINQEITALRKELEIKYEKSRHLNRPRNSLTVAQKIIEDNESIFVKRGAEYDLIKDLEKIAAELALQQNMNLDSKENPINDEIYFLNINILANGDFANLMIYLNKLEKTPVVIAISNIIFSKNNPLTLNIKGKIYVKK